MLPNYLKMITRGILSPTLFSLKLIWFLGLHRYYFSYRKVASSNTSCLEAHVGFFRLLMKGIFDSYVQ